MRASSLPSSHLTTITTKERRLLLLAQAVVATAMLVIAVGTIAANLNYMDYSVMTAKTPHILASILTNLSCIVAAAVMEYSDITITILNHHIMHHNFYSP